MKIIFLLLFNIGLFAQQGGIDSLLQNIKNLPDSSKARFLTTYAWNNRSRNKELALAGAQEALKIAESINNKNLQSTALNYMGLIYRNLGKYDRSIDLYDQALKIANESKDSSQIAYSYNNIGGIYRLEGNNKIALQYIFKALGIFERRGDKQGISYCTVNIGVMYSRQNDYSKALEYLNYTLKIREEIKDKPGKALALNLIAEVRADMGKPDDALKYYFEVEKQYREIDDKRGLAATWGGIGNIYLTKKEYQKALYYQTRSLEISEKIKYTEGQVGSYNDLGKIYYHLGQPARAEEIYKKAIKMASGLKEIYSQLKCYRSIAEFYELKKDKENALLYYKKYYTLRDSATRKENVEMIYQYEANQMILKNENEKNLLQKENESQKKQSLYLLGIIALVIILSAILFRDAHAVKILNKKLKELNSIKDRFFRIIAHDLKNPFTSILGFSEILVENYHELNNEERLELIKEIRSVFKKNYQLLENLLSWAGSQSENFASNPESFKLKNIPDEIESIFLIGIKNKELNYINSIDESVSVYADQNMVKTVLRNLVSNAIKFSHTGGQIKVSAGKKEGWVTVEVEDDGVGIGDEIKNDLFKLDKITTQVGTKGEKGTGLGLILCLEFVEKNGGKIWVDSEEGKGSRFYFTLPENN
jgi:signal transduction histidine kinase